MTTVTTEIRRLSDFSAGDLSDLCEATEAAILDGGGFGWVAPPSRDVLESYLTQYPEQASQFEIYLSPMGGKAISLNELAQQER